MKTIETEIVIATQPKKVWQVLMDFETYPRWNPFITKIKGDADEGSKLQVKIEPPASKPMLFAPVVLRCVKEQEFRWRGKLGIKGIFDGEHYFILQLEQNGHTKLIHGERFSGMLIPFMGGIFEKTRQGFLAMNQALKERCEA